MPAWLPAETMAGRRYDVIVLGESLAGHIAAVLLARSGRRVLLLGEEAPPPAGAFAAGRHLERLLGQLDGLSSLAPPSPLQVLTATCRLTLQSSTPLAEELQREFSGDAGRVGALLDRLRTVGEKLEASLEQSGGLPLTGFASRWRFAWQRLRRGLTRRALARPLSGRLAGLAGESREALAVLFAGLSLLPPERLTTAEAALLWSGCGRPGIGTEALDELLRRHFEQFHGERAALTDLESAHSAAGEIAGVTLRDGRRCNASRYLLADARAGRHLRNLPAALPQAPPPPAGTAAITGAITPLLAPTVILAGSPPLRLALSPEEGRCRVSVHLPRLAPHPDAGELRRRLSDLFPFAEVHLAAWAAPPTAIEKPKTVPAAGAFPGAAVRLTLGPNLLLCSGEAVLPGLGATGEVLVGMSVAAHLQRRRR